jgi:hypothetical protein
MKLTSEQRDFFAAMEATFDTTGWGLLCQGWQAELDRLPEIVFYNAKKIEDVEIARERGKLLTELLSLAAVMTSQREEIDNMDDDNV